MSIVGDMRPITLRGMTEQVVVRGSKKVAKLPDEDVQTSHAEF